MRTLCALVALAAVVAATPVQEPVNTYAGAHVVRVSVETPYQVQVLQQAQRSTLLDFWVDPRIGFVDILAQPEQQAQLASVLRRLDLDPEMLIGDVEAHLEQTKARRDAARAKSTKAMDWSSYHDLDEINAWLEDLAVQYPDLVTVTDVGSSFEGRPMKLLKLSTGGTGKEALFTDSGIHAREWITYATVTYILNELVSGNDPDNLLNSIDFYFMVAINPDGYSYSWTNDRYWRKTRSSQPGVLCLGADPNRNWGFHWMEGGASSEPCAQTYAGSEAFSEIEMRVVRDQLLAIQPRIYLTFHSYSQLWMYPWGYTPDLPENWVDLDNLAQDAVSALTALYGTQYEIGSSTNVIYQAAGGSDDWALGVGGAEYAYTIELRDTGRWGFELPEDQILPSGEETFAGFYVVAQFLAGLAKKH